MFSSNLLLLMFFFVNIIFCKNIILPFKKISIEDFNGRNTINDLINYNIYTNISMGTPPQLVSHFIEQSEHSFNFDKKKLSYNHLTISNFESLYENLTNFRFKYAKSSTFSNNDNIEFFTDIYYFNTLNNSKIKIENFPHNFYLDDNEDDQNKCGIIGLNHKNNSYLKKNNVHFLEELKRKKLIGEYSFTIIYNENNSLFNYKNNLNLGTIIIGESLCIFNHGKFKKEDEIANTEKDWSILVNELKFNSQEDIYTEKNIEMQISLNTGFIKGSNSYRKKIDKIFFSELIKNKFCIVELLVENIFTNEYYVYSCENNKEIKEKIKLFPTLFFEIKTNNLTFIFTYKDLFKQFNDRLYFMVIFKSEKFSAYFPRWIMGEIFLRKYLTSYNYDSKTIIFYKSQVNEMNIKSQILYDATESKKSFSISQHIRTLVEIAMGIFILLILYILYRKFRNSRKIHAYELEDSNYVYMPKENKNIVLAKKENELNKIIN